MLFGTNSIQLVASTLPREFLDGLEAAKQTSNSHYEIYRWPSENG